MVEFGPRASVRSSFSMIRRAPCKCAIPRANAISYGTMTQRRRTAADFLIQLLNGGEPWVLRYKLTPGEGIICNNVLHNRSGFTDAPGADLGRLHLRARYLTRIAGTSPTIGSGVGW